MPYRQEDKKQLKGSKHYTITIACKVKPEQQGAVLLHFNTLFSKFKFLLVAFERKVEKKQKEFENIKMWIQGKLYCAAQ